MPEDKFEHFEHDPVVPRTVSSNQVSAVFEDHTGVIWVGSIGGGVSRSDLATGNFELFRYKSTTNNTLSNNMVFSIISGLLLEILVI